MKNETTKQISSASFRPGRIYSIVYDSDYPMVQTRNLGEDLHGFAADKFGHAINPLYGHNVTVRRVSSVQAAGNKTWANYKRRTDPNWQPSDKPKWYHATENSCIVEHSKNATRYLRGLPRGVTKVEYLIDGIPATLDEVSTLETFPKNKPRDNQEFLILDLSNLVNVIDDGGDEE
jgi:hypothetical protein